MSSDQHEESRHPIEVELASSANDILDAIAAGFRAKIDVKGKLAELYLSRELARLKAQGHIEDFSWNDKDGKPDFTVRIQGEEVVLECKNVRSPSGSELKRDLTERQPRVELQKTRNSADGSNTRGYRAGEFDALSVALFNQTGKWEYGHALTTDLERRPDQPEFLVVMQPVPLQPAGIWKGSLLDVLKEAAQAKRARGPQGGS